MTQINLQIAKIKIPLTFNVAVIYSGFISPPQVN